MHLARASVTCFIGPTEKGLDGLGSSAETKGFAKLTEESALCYVE